jgi:hypothetical protein
MAGPESEAERLTAALNSLLEGESAKAALVELGPAAVPSLRRFLLEGRPSTVYQPRRWAVEALGALGAREVLMEYLALPPVPDPQVEFAEQAVRNAAVREFLRWPDDATVSFLLALAGRMMLPGLAEVFGQLRLAEAIPYLDRALEDDFCRLPAEEALASIGAPARGALILSATTPLPAKDLESPSSLRRRQSVLRVLVQIGVRAEDWPMLRGLLEEEDPEIVTLTCLLAVKSGIAEAAGPGAARLLSIAGRAPWFLLEDIVDCLRSWRESAKSAIAAEVERRMQAPPEVRIQDQTLRVLLRVLASTGRSPLEKAAREPADEP